MRMRVLCECASYRVGVRRGGRRGGRGRGRGRGRALHPHIAVQLLRPHPHALQRDAVTGDDAQHAGVSSMEQTDDHGINTYSGFSHRLGNVRIFDAHVKILTPEHQI